MQTKRDRSKQKTKDRSGHLAWGPNDLQYLGNFPLPDTASRTEKQPAEEQSAKVNKPTDENSPR
jgi:hypothetical protein